MADLLFTNKSRRITGVGSALVDILLQESDQFLGRTPGRKGGMTLVDAQTIERILADSSQKPSIVPGGAACNTIIGVGKLGTPARFVGRRGDDALGELFEQSLHNNDVEPCLSHSPTPTGRVLSIITPDAQRSMFTYLGAASEARADELLTQSLRDSTIVYIEGYLLFNEELMMKVLEAARSEKAVISLDLASFTVVEAAKNILPSIIEDYVDILIANEDEAAAFTGTTDEEKALALLSEDVEIAVVKQGKRGSLIRSAQGVFHADIIGDGSAIDTTGAGDLWAAGFLHGLVNGYSIEDSAHIAAACGYEVCQVIGAQIPEGGWQRIHERIQKLG